jgi:hypothetical protein
MRASYIGFVNHYPKPDFCSSMGQKLIQSIHHFGLKPQVLDLPRSTWHGHQAMNLGF